MADRTAEHSQLSELLDVPVPAWTYPQTSHEDTGANSTYNAALPHIMNRFMLYTVDCSVKHNGNSITYHIIPKVPT